MECTFTPRINKRNAGASEQKDAISSGSSSTWGLNASRFDQLFWDAENRRHRQAEYMQWHPPGYVARQYLLYMYV